MKLRAAILVVAGLVAFPALADMSSVRPMPRPNFAAPMVPDAAITPDGAIEPSASRVSSARPQPRPDDVTVRAKRPKKRGFFGRLFGPKTPGITKSDPQAPKHYASGAVCKDRAIQGTAIPRINGALKGCGIEKPVRVTAVDGVALSTPATLDCDTARALREWVTTELKPAFGRNEVVGLRVAAHYACRGRNNKKGARISEHGRGKAIDISAFTLANGVEVTVLQDFRTNRGRAIRTAHKGACGIFGTTLGPGSDGYHGDHIHLDTATYRGGPYCK